MNKQICDKINFMLSGMVIRAEENADFVKSITYIFKSGLKEYKGTYNIENKMNNFNGISESIPANRLPEYISRQSLNYETLEFAIEERGKKAVLNADSKGVKTRQVDTTGSQDNEKKIKTSQILNRNYFIKIGEADELLREIGVLTKEGKVKNDMIRKYNQIDHFVELIDKMIDEISDVDTINIVDCGCGKSYLTFVLNYYIKEKKKKNCHFIGIDRSAGVIKSSREIAKRLGYKNMEFIEEDLNFYVPDRRIDMVISLHACDIATDMALGLAVRMKARSIVCVPCCHKELIDQYRFEPLEEITKHGVFRARFADMLTDGVRALLLESRGYEVSVVEYISPLETPKNLLIRARKVREKDDAALKEYNRLREMFKISPYLEKTIDMDIDYDI